MDSSSKSSITCNYCGVKFTPQFFQREPGRPPYYVCFGDNCESSKCNKRTNEWKVKALGKNLDDLTQKRKEAVAKGVATVEKNGRILENNPFSYDYWLKRGLSKEEIQEKFKSKAVLSTGTKRERGCYEPNNNPWSHAYWIERGLDFDAHIKKKHHCSPEYWINHGLSEEEAVKAARSSAATNSRSYQILKHGEELGRQRFDAISANKKKSWNISSAQHEFFGVSKEANVFFRNLLDLVDDIFPESDAITKCVGGKEYFICNSTGTYFYDFVVPSLKIAIEYNGVHVHPHPELSLEEKQTWRHAYNKLSYDEIKSRDDNKLNYLRARGYDIIQIYSSDIDKLSVAEEFLRRRIKNEHSNC